jgi:23S rRNA pseudouridine955/2504/2580 synthase
MRELTIGPNDAGQRLDRFVGKAVPLLPEALLQKYIRLKRIKVNGRGAKRDYRLAAADAVQLYISDEFFEKPREENAYLKVGAPRLDIVYEDENILLVDKKPGVLCHSAGQWDYNTLIATSRPTPIRRASGARGRSMPSPRRCATGSTATPAASSSRRKTPRRCAS